ncbi:hypothetical protein FGO68_gene15452 [Halteria grandinella]|uniref:Uncharacterized protein n=1 Tax=Halteria grandinella TaxID=5974 RepID=A0A8J8NFQ3_HALGN|nr:hypothetical protein FGO68_gene15452 [Halteria grandinella]
MKEVTDRFLFPIQSSELSNVNSSKEEEERGASAYSGVINDAQLILLFNEFLMLHFKNKIIQRGKKGRQSFVKLYRDIAYARKDPIQLYIRGNSEESFKQANQLNFTKTYTIQQKILLRVLNIQQIIIIKQAINRDGFNKTKMANLQKIHSNRGAYLFRNWAHSRIAIQGFQGFQTYTHKEFQFTQQSLASRILNYQTNCCLLFFRRSKLILYQ